MDFFAQVNARLLQPPEPRSSLRSYFEAHLLFQDTYHSPATSPESSPEPEERTARQVLTHSKKRKHDSDDEGYTSGPPTKRQKIPALAINIAPSPPTTDDSLPPSPRLQRVATQDSAFHELEPAEPDMRLAHGGLPGAGPSPPLSPTVTNKESGKIELDNEWVWRKRSTSMKVGKYSLRWTAARARRTGG